MLTRVKRDAFPPFLEVGNVRIEPLPVHALHDDHRVHMNMVGRFGCAAALVNRTVVRSMQSESVFVISKLAAEKIARRFNESLLVGSRFGADDQMHHVPAPIGAQRAFPLDGGAAGVGRFHMSILTALQARDHLQSSTQVLLNPAHPMRGRTERKMTFNLALAQALRHIPLELIQSVWR